MQEAVEREWEPQWLEVSEEELARCGWKLYQRIDGHVFTVLVRQGTRLEKAFSEGRGIYARHQLKSIDGRELLSGYHIDLLAEGKIQEQEIMSTVYSPSIGHNSSIVLERTASQPTTK